MYFLGTWCGSGDDYYENAVTTFLEWDVVPIPDSLTIGFFLVYPWCNFQSITIYHNTITMITKIINLAIYHNKITTIRKVKE